MYVIYLIKNIITSKLYVGQTNNLPRRWSQHKSAASLNKRMFPLYRSIKKYGIANFTLEIIEECNKENVDEKEIYWIAFLKTTDKKFGYNLSAGGKPLSDKNIKRIVRPKGWKHSEETKKKMSEQRKGPKNSFYGKHHSDEVKQKMSNDPNRHLCGEKNHFFGKHHTQETRTLISELAKKKTGEKNPFSKLTNNIVLEIRDFYENEKISIAKLARKYNVSEACIACIVHRRSWKHI